MEFLLPLAFIGGLGLTMGLTGKSERTKEESYRPQKDIKTNDYLYEIEQGSFNYPL